MDEDPTIPDQESTQPLTDAGDATDGGPGRWLFAALSLAAIAIGIIVGATIALARDGSTSKQPATSTSGAPLISTSSTSVPAAAPVVTIAAPEKLPPTTVLATVPVTASPTTKPTAPAPPTTQVVVTTPTTAANTTASTTSP
jgi:hypothetical protein